MKQDDLFETQSANDNESTDKRQTSPLGTDGSDSVDKPETTLSAAPSPATVEQPAPKPTEAAIPATSPKVEEESRLIEALKAKSAPPAAKTDAAQPTAAAPETAENDISEKTDIHPPTATTEMTSPPAAKTETVEVVEANLAATASPDINDKTDPAVPVAIPDKPAGLSTQRLDGSKQDTYVISQNRTLRAMLEKRQVKEPEAAPATKIVTLLIRGMPERVVLSNSSVILGRAELQARGFQPDVDLSPYGAQMRGVSRVHARMFVQDKHLYIADLYSTNGTYIAGRKLEPNDPYRLHNGVEILLGSLMIQVLFE